jgi:hypothetical protein
MRRFGAAANHGGTRQGLQSQCDLSLHQLFGVGNGYHVGRRVLQGDIKSFDWAGGCFTVGRVGVFRDVSAALMLH